MGRFGVEEHVAPFWPFEGFGADVGGSADGRDEMGSKAIDYLGNQDTHTGFLQKESNTIDAVNTH